MGLFPFDRAGGLRRQVEDNAVHAFNFVGDTLRDVLQERKRNVFNGSRHGIDRVDGADDDRPSVRTLAVLHAHRLEVRDGREVLPNLAFETVLRKFFTKDSIGFTNSFKTIAGDGAEATNTKTRTRERLTIDHAIRETEGLTDHTDFVLEEELNRFDEAELKVVRETTNVVVSLHAVAFENVPSLSPMKR